MFPVIFVSLGPGEPELITVKGLKALQTADCIFCPETLAKDGNRVSRAADILLQLDIPENTVHRFPLPMSKQREKALSAYDEVYMESSTLRQQGKKVCIVAEGDAGFYSSIHYVYDKLQADGIPVKPTIFLCNTLPVSPPSLPPAHWAGSMWPARKSG